MAELITDEIPPTLEIGDRFRIINDDTPWFAKGLFEAVEKTPKGFKVKRISD